MINFFRQKNSQYLLLDVDAQRLACGLFEVSSSPSVRPMLLSYATKECQAGEFVDAICMNPTAIRSFLVSCINKKQSRYPVPVLVSLSSSVMSIDTYLSFATSAPDYQQFLAVVPPRVAWDSFYIGSIQDCSHLFYMYGLDHTQSFLWTVISRGTPFLINGVIPRTIALSDSYKKFQANAFRLSHWALDITRNNYAMEQVCKAYDLSLMVSKLIDCARFSGQPFLEADMISLCAMAGMIAELKEG